MFKQPDVFSLRCKREVASVTTRVLSKSCFIQLPDVVDRVVACQTLISLWGDFSSNDLAFA